MPLPALPAWATAKLFFKSKKFLIPAAAVTLLLAVGGGTYFYLNHQTKELVASKVEQVNSQATIKSYETKDAINSRTIVIDRKFDDLRVRTAQDYSHARNKIETAPPAEKDAQAPRLLIDTLNDLDRMRADRDSDRVPDTDIPVG